MIYFLQLIKKEEKEPFFTFIHPTTPQQILEKIHKQFKGTPLNFLQGKTTGNTPQTTDFEQFSLHSSPLTIENKNITAVVLHDREDKLKIISEILNDFLTPHIMTRIAREMEDGRLNEETENILTEKILNLINKRIDPISRNWGQNRDQIIIPLTSSSLLPLTILFNLLFPIFQMDLNIYHYIINITIVAGIFGYLSQNRKWVLKNSILCVLLNIFGSIAWIILVKKVSLTTLSSLSFLVLNGSIIFVISTLLLTFLLDNQYLWPP